MSIVAVSTEVNSSLSAVGRRLIQLANHIPDTGTDLRDRQKQLTQKYFVISDVSPDICFEVERDGRILRALFLNEVPEGSEFAEFDRDGVCLILHGHGQSVSPPSSPPSVASVADGGALASSGAGVA